ncbi:MAG: fused DSP-PTPase phosphatase/NAD kinase-like protein [Thioalkalivibrionaceae bacterium]
MVFRSEQLASPEIASRCKTAPDVVRQQGRRGLIQDDGWVREYGLHNFHVVSSGLLRSGQPSPRHLCRWLPRFGVKTVINLRGDEPDNPMVNAERVLLAHLGVRFESVRMLSRAMPSVATIERLYALAQQVPGPVWVHCKSGADRAGLAAALLVHWREGVALDNTQQLRLWPYWHYRWSKTGRLDAFIAAYRRDTAQSGKALIDWVREDYDRERETAAFVRPRLRSALLDWWTDRVLRRE